MRRIVIAALILVAVGCGDESDPAPLVQSTCDLPSGGQCAVYTLPSDWPVDVRASCESSGGTWGVPCPESGRVGTCTCTGLGGISTVVYDYGTVRTIEQASASCTGLGCAWTVP